MNAYFFKMSQQERNNILDQHKTIYDGFVTQYAQNSNTQPLYVQDYANDKGGITVNNKGGVGIYTNMNINESDAFTGAKYLPDESFDFGGPDEELQEYVSLGERLDKIGDGEHDFEHGTFDDEEFEEESCRHCNGLGYDEETEENCEWCDGTGIHNELHLSNKFDVFPKTKWSYDKNIGIEVDEEFEEPLQEQINKTLDMFKRFKTFL